VRCGGVPPAAAGVGVPESVLSAELECRSAAGGRVDLSVNHNQSIKGPHKASHTGTEKSHIISAAPTATVSRIEAYLHRQYTVDAYSAYRGTARAGSPIAL